MCIILLGLNAAPSALSPSAPFRGTVELRLSLRLLQIITTFN